MMSFLNAHGFDPGPTQRPLLAGALSGAIAAIPAIGVMAAFKSYMVAADQIARLSRPLAVLGLLGAFAAAGLVYGRLFGRAAEDRRGGWMFGLAFGFALWIAAPVVVAPLLNGSAMAAGRPAMGFFAAFVVWGLLIGGLFPFVHAPLQSRLDGSSGVGLPFGPAVFGPVKLLRRRSGHAPGSNT